MKKYYLAYGSNLNLEEMKSRCPLSKPVGAAVIPNYRLVYKGVPYRSFLTIEPCEGETVPVGIYEITEKDEARLDIYEGVPSLYTKERITITVDGTELEAIIYIMNSKHSYNFPSEKYLARCLEGYQQFNFDTAHLINALFTTELNLSRQTKKQKNH